jgi:hypothetical protein
MAFIVEIIQFPSDRPVKLAKRIQDIFDNLDDAKKRGEEEISISNLQFNPIGFRIKNGFGMQVYLRQPGHDD